MDYLVMIEKMEEDFESDFEYREGKRIVCVTNCNSELDARIKARDKLVKDGEDFKAMTNILTDDGYFYRTSIIELQEGVIFKG